MNFEDLKNRVLSKIDRDIIDNIFIVEDFYDYNTAKMIYVLVKYHGETNDRQISFNKHKNFHVSEDDDGNKSFHSIGFSVDEEYPDHFDEFIAFTLNHKIKTYMYDRNRFND